MVKEKQNSFRSNFFLHHTIKLIVLTIHQTNQVIYSMIKQGSIVVLLFLLLFQQNLIAQKGSMLPRSTPEAEGVPSENIIQFLDAAAKSKTEFHSFMLLRHGKVIAEGWWNPYRANLKHTLYSCSKSFTATAIGFAVQEKRLKLDDK